MIGAILGDIIGSPYEFNRGNKRKDFPLFSKRSRFTDDSVMTVAIASAFLKIHRHDDESKILKVISNSLREYGLMYRHAGYGRMFIKWLLIPNSQAYNSFGNGSAMRVSSVAWLFDDLDSVRWAARLSAMVTHNHPEGIKGAEAIACAIFLARSGSNKDEIKKYIETEFGYLLNRTCAEIRVHYVHTESCMESVPEAITAFLEGNSFEDVIRTAVSLGGDCDTIGAIAGSIAEGYYGVDDELRRECFARLPEPLLRVVNEFEKRIGKKNIM